MLAIPGFHIDALLSEHKKTVVYRARPVGKGAHVILKTLKTEYPKAADIARLKHEYDISGNLDISGVVKARGLITYKNSPVLILEDFGGESLASLARAGTLDARESIHIGIQLASALGELHQNRIIHKNIHPANIIINAETRRVKLTDFSISSRLSRENQTICHPNRLEGSLAYMSPEQTGRMNRSIDYRTDFYSLGATLYELLVGRPPFQGKDPMGLVHCHIARRPEPPRRLNAEIPESVSGVVMKLLAKTAEERYQSAYGIRTDLECCLEMMDNPEKDTRFSPGRRDISGQFAIPQKLYGRESEIAVLMSTFDRVSHGCVEMMLVAGYSGIGKSMLVNEIHKPIVRQRGYFITGKYDQFKRHIPYSALIQAFQELIRGLLVETETTFQDLRRKLLSALGPNGQVMIDVIPDLELIIGPQPDPAPLPASETQNRFNMVLKNFIRVFTRKGRPLVIFLDDLQWTDLASLEFIKRLAADPDGRHLLMIGAYRNNETGSTHPLTKTLGDIRRQGVKMNVITLRPLALSHVTQLVADTLGRSPRRVRPLAELALEKTEGAPFFLTQLLQHLYWEGALTFNSGKGEWEWDIDQIRGKETSDNVVELMVRKIEKLSGETRNVLKLAACIGNRFNLYVLSIVHEQSQGATAAALWEALRTGLIIPLSPLYGIPRLLDSLDGLVIEYKFLHDRVQQAAYTLIPDEQKKRVHLKVGRLLLRNSRPGRREETIFDIVNHMNMGAELVRDEPGRYELARLNLVAGRKAKGGAAFESAREYLTAGLDLLPGASWETRYELTLELYEEAVEVAFLNTRFHDAQRLSEIVFTRARALIDKVNVYVVRIQFYIARNQMTEAAETALLVADLLGAPVSLGPDDLQLTAPLPEIDDLDDFPEMTDPVQLAVLEVLTIVTGPIYQTQPQLLPYIVYKMVNLCLEFGHSALAAYAYGMHGMMCCGALEDIETGYHSGKLSLKIQEQFNAREFTCKTSFLFNAFVRHWKEPLHQSISALSETTRVGFETGDFVYATYASIVLDGYPLLSGAPLEAVEKEQAHHVALLKKLKQEYGFYSARIWRQLTLNLQGRAREAHRLAGESFDEEDLKYLWKIKNRMLTFYAYLAKLILACLFGDFAAAVANANIASELEPSASAQMFSGAYVFYDSLARLVLYPDLDGEEQLKTLQRVEANQERTREWARHAPMNFRNKYELVEAEKARVLSRTTRAMDYYDRAIGSAREHGFINEAAIAAERASEFYADLGRERFARLYLIDAHYAYERWGAWAKVEELEKRRPDMFNRPPRGGTAPPVATLTPSGASPGDARGMLDFSTVMRASRAISGEIVLDKLLWKLMSLVAENAGADKGFLLLEEEDQWIAKAEWSSAGRPDRIPRVVAPGSVIPEAPASVINFVARTRKHVVLGNALGEGPFTRDPYIMTHQPKSVLCHPMLNQGKLVGIFYLENSLTTGAFTPDRLGVLSFLSSQAAISLENATLYNTLEHKVEERTRQLIRTKEEAESANRAKSEFLANMSHEIRTPLNAVIGFGELLSALVSEPRQQSYLNAIKTAGKSLLTLINDILDLSKMEAGRMDIRNAPVNIRMIFKEIEQIFKMKTDRKNLRFQLELEEALPSTLLLDETRLRQILLNLVGNAVKFTEKGSIRLWAKMARDAARNGRTNLIITVEDTGVGIPAEEHEKIFESFRQQQGQDARLFGGTGLGLSICKRLVEMMNGSISVTSVVGRGSAFEITFQDIEIASSAATATEGAALDAEHISFEKAKILVVDDTESNRALLRELLSSVNLDVLTAENGREALLLTREYRPDLIIIDVRMPVMDGIEAARRLKENAETAPIPIIAMTASAKMIHKSKLLEIGVEEYLTKPMSVHELFTRLARYLKHALKTGPPGKNPDAERIFSDRDMEEVTHPDELAAILRREILPALDNLKIVMKKSDINRLSDRIGRLGEERNARGLTAFAEKMREAAGSFDVGKVKKLLHEFPTLVREFIETEHGETRSGSEDANAEKRGRGKGEKRNDVKDEPT